MKLKYIYVIWCTLILALSFNACSDDDTPQEKEPDYSNINGTDIDKTTTLLGVVKNQEGQPVKGVVVTDGFTTAVTDNNGVYQLARHKKAKFAYYTTPADYAIAVDESNYPAYYKALTSKDKIIQCDFVLSKKISIENDFTLFCVADPQCKTTSQIARYNNETMVDIEKTQGNYKNVYGVTLGDIVFDTPELWGDMKRSMANRSIPFFQTIGNHDHLETADNEDKSIENYQAHFGPTDYSFNRGNVHIVTMDNVIYSGAQVYSGGFTDNQWKWLQEDLSHVSKDKMIILNCHIPFRNGGSSNHETYRQETIDLLAEFAEAHIMIGHTHYQQNYLHKKGDKTVYEHVHGAACGAWWNSTVCVDGSPNGYGIYEISGNSMKKWLYKATMYDETYQIRAYDAAQLFGSGNYTYQFGAAANLNLTGEGWIVANIWNSDPNWKVELYQDGLKVADMTRKSTRDLWAAYYHMEELGKAKGSTFDKSLDHFYAGQLKTSVKGANFEIVATDYLGNRHSTKELKTDFDKIASY